MDEMSEFASFQKTHQKQYKDKKERDMRFKIWKENLEFVRQHNADSSNTFKVPCHAPLHSTPPQPGRHRWA